MEQPTMVSFLPQNTPGLIDLIIESVLMFLCYVSVALRLWSRSLQRKQLDWNDWIIILATLLMTGRYIIEMIGVIECGLGLHIAVIAQRWGEQNTMALLQRFLQLAYGADILWVTIVYLVKLSILHLYVTIFRQPWFVKTTWVMIGFCSLVWLGGFLTRILLCLPVAKNWNPALEGTCGDYGKMLSGVASVDLIVDVFVILLPMPVLWRLQMKMAKKIAITCVFALGFLIIALTCVRIQQMLMLDQTDLTYSFISVAIFSSLVPLLGIINACLPVMPPAINRIFGKSLFGSSKDSSYADSRPKSHYFSSSKLPSRASYFERIEEPGIGLVESPRSPRKMAADNILLTTEFTVHESSDTGDGGAKPIGHAI